MIDFVTNFLVHHIYKSVAILAKKDSEFISITNIEKNTITPDIYINKDIEVEESDRVHTFNDLNDIKGLYSLLCLIEYENIDFKSLKGDSVLLYYKKDNIDFFATWEILRNNFNHIYLVIEKEEDVRTISVFDKEESDIELSVIFPVYNVEKYLNKCIETVTKWDAPYVEFLFVNDGSKDNSAKVILEASKTDKRIKLINKENGGCASAREKGLELAKGRYVSFIDPDDFIDPSMHKKLLEAALKGTYDISYCGYNEYYENTKKTVKVKDLLYKPFIDGIIDRYNMNLLMAYLRIGIWRMIFNRKFLLDNNIHFHVDIKRYDDLPFKVETLALAKSAIGINEYLYFYRLERQGQDVSINDERLFVHFDIFKHLDEFFLDKDDKQKEFYKVIKRDTHNWALSNIRKDLVKEYKRLMKENN